MIFLRHGISGRRGAYRSTPLLEEHGSAAPPLAGKPQSATPVVIWIGPGVYHRQVDNVIRARRALLGGGFSDTYHWKERGDVSKDFALFDGEGQIALDLIQMGLPLASGYTGLTAAECDQVSRIAQRFNLPWYWLAYPLKRFLRPPVVRCVMSVNFVPYRSIYEKRRG